MRRKIQAGRIFFLILLGILGLAGLVIFGFYLAYQGKIFPGISITGQRVGNLTVSQAMANLQPEATRLENQQIILTYQDRKWPIDLKITKLTYDLVASVQRAYHIGRSGHLVEDAIAKKKAWFKGVDLDLVYFFDQKQLNRQIGDIAKQVFIPTINPQIKISNQTIIVEPGQQGQELDQAKLMSLMAFNFSRGEFLPIELPVSQLLPYPTDKQISQAKLRAEKLLGQKLIFLSDENKWELNDEELIKLISFTNHFDEEKINHHAANFASVIDHSSQNATFTFENGRVLEFRPAVVGQSLDREKTVELIKKALTEIENEISPSSQEKTVYLAITKTEPAVTLDKINDLGIKERLGHGVSYYQGSNPSRVHNIVLASSKLDGVLVPPGGTFSFNQTIGDISPATGYQQALVIKEGRTILGDGGGVCQVSTTLFRAILDAGVPIVERHSHSYRVSYYEQGGFGPGLDATIWIPGVDLQFKNDTPAHLLIQTRVNQNLNLLTFEIFGTNDDRSVTLARTRIWDQTAPPPDLYTDDPTLPAGTVKQVEKSNWGAKVSFHWKVIRNEEVLQDQNIYSHYQPWQAIYLRGTGP